MRKRRMLRTFAVVVALAACGSKPPATSTTSSPAAHADEHHADLPPALAKLHDVLAPRWHAAKGPERMTSTCQALADFQRDSDEVAKATPPAAANAQAWTAGTQHLSSAVVELGTACKGSDLAVFEAAFTSVHQGFHELLGASGMMHEDHEGKGDHEHAHEDHGM
jgi:membrane-bound lytic murein transglycosylase B